MKLKTITVTYGRKLNLGDYNSSHVEMSLWAELDEGDCEVAASEALRQMARNNVMSELARLQPKLEAKVQDIFMGLPVDVQKQVMGEKASGPLTWEQVADIYDSHSNGQRKARTMQMDHVFDYVARLDGFYELDGQLYREDTN